VNPFTGPDSDLVIVSVDTLSGGRTRERFGESGVEPYDLVVFDEAHKLSAEPRLPRAEDRSLSARRKRCAPVPSSAPADSHAAHGEGLPLLLQENLMGLVLTRA
jgi:hypothetical protein